MFSDFKKLAKQRLPFIVTLAKTLTSWRKTSDLKEQGATASEGRKGLVGRGRGGR
jgi:hypothetical protein